MVVPHRPRPPALGRCWAGAAHWLAWDPSPSPSLCRPLSAAWRHPAGPPPTFTHRYKRVPRCRRAPPFSSTGCARTPPPLSLRLPVHSSSPKLPRAHRIWLQCCRRLILLVSFACAAFVSRWSPASQSPSPPPVVGPLGPRRRPPELPRFLGTPPPSSPSTHRFGELPSTRPCPAGSLSHGGSH
jgi:hypothetical protein